MIVRVYHVRVYHMFVQRVYHMEDKASQAHHELNEKFEASNAKI